MWNENFFVLLVVIKICINVLRRNLIFSEVKNVNWMFNLVIGILDIYVKGIFIYDIRYLKIV